MAQIGAIISIIKAIIDLWRYFQGIAEENAVKAKLKKEQDLKTAMDSLKNATTEEDIYAAQEKISKLKN